MTPKSSKKMKQENLQLGMIFQSDHRFLRKPKCKEHVFFRLYLRCMTISKGSLTSLLLVLLSSLELKLSLNSDATSELMEVVNCTWVDDNTAQLLLFSFFFFICLLPLLQYPIQQSSCIVPNL